jgi:hypothetical protein
MPIHFIAPGWPAHRPGQNGRTTRL